MPAARRTGLSGIDAQDDFLRARRRRLVARMGQLMMRERGDVNVILPFDEVVEALGRVGERDLGLQVVALDTIVGTTDRQTEFDRHFRPTTPRVRSRWERVAAAVRRGEPLPPVELYRIGEAHFVRDGHHRVSVARTLGWHDIDAHVTEVLTRVGTDHTLRMSDLPTRSRERLFRERVPLPPQQAARIVLSDPREYGSLAEGVEAWGFRHMQERGELLDRVEVARLWYDHEYRPVVDMLREAGLLTRATEADAYHWLAGERYELTRTHDWSDEIIEMLRATQRRRR